MGSYTGREGCFKGFHIFIMYTRKCERSEKGSLGPHSEQLEGDSGGPLLVLHLAKGRVGSDSVRVKRQTRHKADLQVRLTLTCTVTQTALLNFLP